MLKEAFRCPCLPQREKALPDQPLALPASFGRTQSFQLHFSLGFIQCCLARWHLCTFTCLQTALKWRFAQHPAPNPPYLKVGSCAPSHCPLVCLPPTHQSSQWHMTNPCSVVSGPEDAVCSRLPQTRMTSVILYSSQERQFIKCNF